MPKPMDFSETVHAYLDAPKGAPDEVQALLNLLLFPRLPGQWVGGMGQGLEAFSAAELAGVLATGDPEIPAAIRDRIESKWLLLANVLKSPLRSIECSIPLDPKSERQLEPRPEESRRLLLRLYSFIRRMEFESKKWWHKGTVGWFLGLSHLEAHEPDQAVTYFVLAATEDGWSSERSGGLDPRSLPAFLGLRVVAPDQADDLFARCLEVITAKGSWSVLEPEVTYLKALCRLDCFATPRGPLPFAPGAAQAFFEAADQAQGNVEKGAGYELLLAYLFEASDGFQAVLNAIGRDQENDLLVVNRRTDIPLRCLGEFLICQCKNTQDSAGAAIVREFAGRLLEAGCESGLLLCKKGISGQQKDPSFPQDAVATRMKARQREGMNILTLERDDLAAICAGKPRFDTYLSDEYVRVRFDLLRDDETKAGGKKTTKTDAAGAKVAGGEAKATPKRLEEAAAANDASATPDVAGDGPGDAAS